MSKSKYFDKDIFTTGEVADICGVSFRTVIRWIKRGELVGYQLPGRGDNRVIREELHSFMNKNNIPVPEFLKNDFPQQEQASDSEERQAPIALVVDDELSSVEIAKGLLSDEGFEVETAVNGFIAGIKLMELQPDLMILDLSMPGVDGFEVLTLMKRLETRIPKVIVVSAMEDEYLERAMMEGADAALKKPLDSQAFLKHVDRLVLRQFPVVMESQCIRSTLP